MTRRIAGSPAVAPVAALLAGTLLVAVLAATPAAAEPVAGTVVDLDGAPLADVDVELRDDGGATVAATSTDDDGRFAFDDEGATIAVVDDDHRRGEVDAASDVELTALPPRIAVERLAGPSRVETAVAAAHRGFPDGAGHALLAAAGNWPDALAAAPLAHQRGAPLLLAGARLDGAPAATVADLATETSTVMGAVGAVPLVVQADADAAGIDPDRIAGETRTDTAALTARAAFPDGADTAVVATSVRFPDALAAGALAAVLDAPVLLTGPDRLDGDAADALKALAATSTVVVGGTAAVSDDAMADLPEPRRLAGAERYATGAQVARAVLDAGGDPSTVVVATGRDFPDALAGSVLAGLGGHPLVVLDGHDPDGAGAAWGFLADHAADIGRILVLGGPAAVSDEVVARLEALDADGGGGDG